MHDKPIVKCIYFLHEKKLRKPQFYGSFFEAIIHKRTKLLVARHSLTRVHSHM